MWLRPLQLCPWNRMTFKLHGFKKPWCKRQQWRSAPISISARISRVALVRVEQVGLYSIRFALWTYCFYRSAVLSSTSTKLSSPIRRCIDRVLMSAQPAVGAESMFRLFYTFAPCRRREQPPLSFRDNVRIDRAATLTVELLRNRI